MMGRLSDAASTELVNSLTLVTSTSPVTATSEVAVEAWSLSGLCSLKTAPLATLRPLRHAGLQGDRVLESQGDSGALSGAHGLHVVGESIDHGEPPSDLQGALAGRGIAGPLPGVADRSGDGSAADESLDGDRPELITAASVVDRIGHRLPGGQQDVSFSAHIYADADQPVAQLGSRFRDVHRGGGQHR